MLALFPEGFEERSTAAGVELAAFTDAEGERLLRAAFGDVQVTEVAAGWEHRWRDYHSAVRIGPLWIGPTWETPPPGSAPVVIDPGLAFGTGSHATTRLCLEFLLDLPLGSALDLGCGSGVLAIAAARLGFAPVTAVDHDLDAIDATSRNARANAVAVETVLADLRELSFPDADVTLANVSLEAVEALAPRLTGRVLVASGYLSEDRPRLAGFRARTRRERDGWAAELFERTD